MELQGLPASSSRILYDVPCAVCQDHSSGKHYGVFACDGCAGFFKRSVRRDRRYTCKARTPGACLIDKAHRNQCRACRMAKCLDVRMNKDAVQHERGPRNSTIRRQMALFLKDPNTTDIGIPSEPILDLALPKTNFLPPPPMVFQNSYYARVNMMSAPMAFPVAEVRMPPLMLPSLMSQGPSEPEVMCEAAARLLFMNVKWIKNIPYFASLSLADRTLLLEETWRDLFIIGTAQFLYPLDLKMLLNGRNPRLEKKHVEIFDAAVNEIMKMCLDANEFACLRALMLFKTNFEKGQSHESPDECKKLQDLQTIAAIQEQSHNVLSEYVLRAYPMDVNRTSRIFQLIGIIRSVPSSIITELFFRPTIGEITIERIISDMYKTGKDDL